jgi:hypothetical protein
VLRAAYLQNTPKRGLRAMKKWAFRLGEPVQLVKSGERGEVIGRAEYSHMPDGFYVRYTAGDHRQTESWWSGDALASLAPPRVCGR